MLGTRGATRGAEARRAAPSSEVKERKDFRYETRDGREFREEGGTSCIDVRGFEAIREAGKIDAINDEELFPM